MATLISVYTSNGCVGRCDARCHDATSDKCTCVCGGMNHGDGVEAAIDNTREHFDKMIKDYQKGKYEKMKFKIGSECKQLSLFK